MLLPLRPRLAPALLLALPMTFGSAAALAESTLDRVEVHTMPVRVDVRKSCPGVDAQLQMSLARTWYLEQKPGLMRVNFQLDGQKLSAVKTSGKGKAYYDQAIRRAMRQLSCEGPSGQPQQYTFLISFSEEGSGEQQGQWMALLER